MKINKKIIFITCLIALIICIIGTRGKPIPRDIVTNFDKYQKTMENVLYFFKDKEEFYPVRIKRKFFYYDVEWEFELSNEDKKIFLKLCRKTGLEYIFKEDNDIIFGIWDSEYGIVYTTKTLEELNQDDTKPYRKIKDNWVYYVGYGNPERPKKPNRHFDLY